LFVGDLEPLAPPDTLDPLVVDHPTGLVAEHLRDLAVAVAAVSAGQGNQVGRQPFLVWSAPRNLALRRAMLPERRTSATLGHRQHRPDMVDHCPSARGA
jgi:hypothetical protein